jgi:hypothetical protein
MVYLEGRAAAFSLHMHRFAVFTNIKPIALVRISLPLPFTPHFERVFSSTVKQNIIHTCKRCVQI